MAKRKSNKRNKIPHHKKAAFLAAFAEVGTIGRAAEASGVDRGTHYRWLEADNDYAKAFSDAAEAAADKLEAEARRRAHDGLLRMKFHQGEPIIDPRTKEPYFELEYSDTLLIFLLKGARPEKFRDNVKVEHAGKVSTANKTTIDLSGLSDDELLKFERAFTGRPAGVVAARGSAAQDVRQSGMAGT